jgi:hypothetical protein
MMKKIVEKIRARVLGRKKGAKSIEEHREAVLAKGRRFKYPLQYAKHRLVINALIIGVVAVIFGAVMLWLQLYKFQNTGDVVFRITRVLPLPVAEIDGRWVLYSDYLMVYRSSVVAVERQQGKFADDEDGRTMIEHYKRVAMDDAEAYSYAMKLGEEMGVVVTDEMIAEASREHRMVGGVERSEASFAKIVNDNFGLSMEEYRRLLMLSLMEKEVAVRVDEEALGVAEEVEKMLGENGGDFAKVAEAMGEKVDMEMSDGMVDYMNLDGGRAEMAAGLEVGGVSGRFVGKSGDGYYFVKTVAKDEGQVEYVSLRVMFREFDRRIEALRGEGRVREFIDLVE